MLPLMGLKALLHDEYHQHLLLRSALHQDALPVVGAVGSGLLVMAAF